MEHTVKVVAHSVISSLGFGSRATFDAMLRGETGIRLVDDAAIYPEPFQAGLIDGERFEKLRVEKGLKGSSRFDSLAILAVEEALANVDFDLSKEKTLLVLSTTKGNIDFLQSIDKGELSKKDATQITPAYLWKSAQNIAGYFKITTLPVVVSNACVSGISAVDVATKLLKNGSYDNALVVGADLVSAFTVSGFQSFKSISLQPCKPYDAERDGLSIGEGAACVVLQKTAQPAPGDICILGGATSNDANHISGPSRTGDGLHYAIERAIAEAGILKSDIDFLNLHGTATIFNDEMESKAINLSELAAVPTVGLKGYIGHTLGASGIMELALGIEALQRGELPATRGFCRLGVPEKMNILAENSKRTFHTFVKTASGFGGFNAAIVVSRKPQVASRKLDFDGVKSMVAGKCIISEHKITVNNKILFEDTEHLLAESFLKAAFKNLQEPNMKFYKMDNLCKLGYVAAEYLLKNVDFTPQDKRRVTLILSNSASSLDTDIDHQLTICDSERYFPSPAVFVYTLPNIVIGEICIKEKFQGEIQFFVTEKYDADFLQQYANLLFAGTDTEAVICGCVDCLGENISAELSLKMKVAGG